MKQIQIGWSNFLQMASASIFSITCLPKELILDLLKTGEPVLAPFFSLRMILSIRIP
jgi:hypothetical protein